MTAEAGGASRRLYGLVFLTIFLDLLGFGIIIPIQPFYAEAFGASPTQVTWLGAAYSLMQFLFVPLWGRLSDRIGRRPVVLVSIAFAIAGYIAFGLAGSLGMLFAARMLSGFGNANIATVQAILADITAPEDRAKAMGLIGAAFGLGFIVGPGVGGLLGGWLGPEAPAFAAAGMAAINWVFAFFALPETLPPEARAEAQKAGEGLGSMRAAFSRRAVRPLLVLTLVTVTSFALMEQCLGLFIERAWVPDALLAEAGSAEQAALHKRATLLTTWVLLLVGVVATVVQGGLIGPLSRRFGERRLIQVGLIVAGVGMVGIPAVGSLGIYWVLLPVSALLAIGSGLYTPSLSASLSKSVSGSEQGAVLGVGQALGSGGRVLGPVVAGPLFEITPDMPFLVGGAGLLLAVVLALRPGDEHDQVPVDSGHEDPGPPGH
ncbi:MAG: MFS transporter [Deltaproteobacteria bacterium]|nr:MFS transporter [Deltaproteobacteria bacterium]